MTKHELKSQNKKLKKSNKVKTKLSLAVFDQLKAQSYSERTPPEDTLKWLSEQYTKMYDHITEVSEAGGQPNYQLVANWLTDAPEWNYELVEHFTELATLQSQL